MNNIEELVCDESFQQYCLGQDAVTNSYWEEQLKLHPEMIKEARRIVNILSANQGSRLDHSRQLQDGLQQAALLQQLLAAKKPKRGLLYITAGIAAAGLILLGIKLLQPATIPVPTTTYAATQHPRQTYILSDGTVITLREHGQLLVSTDFDKNTREVTLTGEAFFDVKHNQHPFIVHTRTADITVLGTTFNVSAYPGKETETILFHGKVVVNRKAQPEQKVILQPNQKFITKIYTQDTKATPVWVHNQLEIDNEPLEEIAKKLQQWYGIPVIFSDEAVKSYRYSGTFESETVIKALEALQLSYPFNFKINNNVIVISK
jgi:transmembrane sensor